jgi:hypothetical protein
MDACALISTARDRSLTGERNRASFSGRRRFDLPRWASRVMMATP